jgi:hypothetical protein
MLGCDDERKDSCQFEDMHAITDVPTDCMSCRDICTDIIGDILANVDCLSTDGDGHTSDSSMMVQGDINHAATFDTSAQGQLQSAAQQESVLEPEVADQTLPKIFNHTVVPHEQLNSGRVAAEEESQEKTSATDEELQPSVVESEPPPRPSHQPYFVEGVRVSVELTLQRPLGSSACASAC